MTTPRAEHSATLLPDGKVVIAGGAGRVPSAELYDPVTKTFPPTPDVAMGRSGHAATLLLSGRVLVTGERSAVQPKELVLEIAKQHLDGRRFERRLEC